MNGDAAWPGDFIRPTPAGTLVGTPWVYGDADFANWGVDTADTVLDNADGWADGTVLMQPGAPATDYATASISTPVSAQTVSIKMGTDLAFPLHLPSTTTDRGDRSDRMIRWNGCSSTIATC